MFLIWFVDEQVEEEANVQSVIDKLMLVGESNLGIYFLDKEIAVHEGTRRSKLIFGG